MRYGWVERVEIRISVLCRTNIMLLRSNTIYPLIMQYIENHRIERKADQIHYNERTKKARIEENQECPSKHSDHSMKTGGGETKRVDTSLQMVHSPV